MSFFESVYSTVFGKIKSNPILVQGVINRNQRFIKQFQIWKSSDLCHETLNEIWQSYFWKKRGIDKNPHVSILESKHSNGISINFDPKYDPKNFHYLFDYLADQVKKMNYSLVLSRETTKEIVEHVETKELHYLKPKRGVVEPIDQRYGNIQIECRMIDNQPTVIKLLANGYPDRKYKEVRNFDELVEHIFN